MKKKKLEKFDVFGTCQGTKAVKLIESGIDLLRAWDIADDPYYLEIYENIYIVLSD